LWIPASSFKNSDRFSGPWILAFLFKNSDKCSGPWILGCPSKIQTDSAVRGFLPSTLKIQTDPAVRGLLKIRTDSAVLDTCILQKFRLIQRSVDSWILISKPWIPSFKIWTDSSVLRYLHPPSKIQTDSAVRGFMDPLVKNLDRFGLFLDTCIPFQKFRPTQRSVDSCLPLLKFRPMQPSVDFWILSFKIQTD